MTEATRSDNNIETPFNLEDANKLLDRAIAEKRPFGFPEIASMESDGAFELMITLIDQKLGVKNDTVEPAGADTETSDATDETRAALKNTLTDNAGSDEEWQPTQIDLYDFSGRGYASDPEYPEYAASDHLHNLSTQIHEAALASHRKALDDFYDALAKLEAKGFPFLHVSTGDKNEGPNEDNFGEITAMVRGTWDVKEAIEFFEENLDAAKEVYYQMRDFEKSLSSDMFDIQMPTGRLFPEDPDKAMTAAQCMQKAREIKSAFDESAINLGAPVTIFLTDREDEFIVNRPVNPHNYTVSSYNYFVDASKDAGDIIDSLKKHLGR